MEGFTYVRRNSGPVCTESYRSVLYKPILKAITKELNVGGKKVFMPIRIAMTGQMHGPDLVRLIEVLGRERVVSRIDRTMAKVLT